MKKGILILMTILMFIWTFFVPFILVAAFSIAMVFCMWDLWEWPLWISITVGVLIFLVIGYAMSKLHGK
jgi:hypothetical protein